MAESVWLIISSFNPRFIGGTSARVCVELPKGEGYPGGAAPRASVTGTVGALLKRLFS